MRPLELPEPNVDARGRISPRPVPATSLVIRRTISWRGDLAAQKKSDALSVPKDRDPIRQADDFGKTMSDVEHRFSLRSKLHHPFDQQLGIRLRQHRRGLVKNHDLTGMDEGPSYLRQPKMRNAEAGSFGVRVEVAPTLAKAAATVRLSSALRWPRLARRAFASQQDIPADRELRHHQNVLRHHCDAEPRRLIGPGHGDDDFPRRKNPPRRQCTPLKILISVDFPRHFRREAHGPRRNAGRGRRCRAPSRQESAW